MANYRSVYRQPYRSAHRSVKRGSAWGSMVSAPSDLEQLLLSQSDASPYRSGTARLQDTSAGAGTYREKLTQQVFAPDGVGISADTGLDLVGTTETDFTILIAAKIASGASASDFIIGDDQTSGTRRWGLRVESNGYIEWFASPDGGVSAYHLYEGDTVIDDDALHFIAARVEDGVLTGLEIDGVADSISDNTVGSPAGTVRTGGENICIGARACADSFLEANFHFAAIATGSDAADLWAERETVRTGFEPTVSCDGIWYFEEGNGANIVNAVDGTIGTIANYVSSARPVDTDRTYTIGNRKGYTPGYIGTDSTSDSTLVLSAAECAVKTSSTLSFDIETTDSQGLVFGNNINSPPFFGCFQDGNGGSTASSAGTFNITVDGVAVANTRDALHDAISDGQRHTVEYTGLDLTSFTNGLYVFGYTLSLWSFLGNVTNITIDGETIELNATRIPPQSGSDTLDAFGGDRTYKGRCPMDGIAKGPAWKGNGTDVEVPLVDEWNDFMPTGATWELELYAEYDSAETGGYFSAGNLNRLTFIGASAEIRLSWGSTSAGDRATFDVTGITDGWHKFTLTYDGVSDVSLYVDDILISTETPGVRTGTATELELFKNGTAIAGNHAIGLLSFTTGGVTTTYVPIEGMRHVAKLDSSGTLTDIIYDAVTGGTLSTLYTLGDGSWELPHLKNGCRWASENRVKNSEDMLAAGWGSSGATITAVSGGPVVDGVTLQAHQVEADSTGFASANAAGLAVADDETYTISAYIKAGTYTTIHIVNDSNAGNDCNAIFDLDAETATPNNDCTCTLTSVGDGWYRATLTTTAPVGEGTVTARFRIREHEIGDTAFFAGPQLHEGSVLLPYNPVGSNIWEASALVPCDDQGNSADGSTPNIEAGDHPRGLTVRREGSVADDISKAIGLDVWGDEVFDDVIQRNDLAKRRVNEFSSDRYAAKIDGNIKNNAYFDNDYRTVEASAGTFTSPTTDEEQDVTGLAFEPKITGIFGGGFENDNNLTDARIGFGVAANVSEQSTVSGSSEGNASPSEANRTYSQSEVVTLLNTSASLEDAEFVNNLSNGFRLNWTKANASEYIYNRFNLGGLDLERSVTFQQMNATLSDESFAHGLSGKPTLLIMFTHGNSALGSNAGAIWALGAWANGSQISASFVSRDNVVTTEAYRYFSEQYTINRLSNAGSLLRAMTVNSVDEDEVQVSYSGSNTTQFKFTMLAVRGCTAQVGAFNCDGGEIDIPHVGMTPKLWLPVTFPSAANSPDGTLNDVLYGIGACDGTNNVSSFYSDVDGRDTTTVQTRTRRAQSSDSIRVCGTTGSTTFEATATLEVDNVKVTPTTASASWDEGGYITIGD